MVNHEGWSGILPAFGSCVDNVRLFDDGGEALPALRAFER